MSTLCYLLDPPLQCIIIVPSKPHPFTIQMYMEGMSKINHGYALYQNNPSIKATPISSRVAAIEGSTAIMTA